MHFDIIFPLLEEIRRWQHPIRLVKVKSHSGCQLNEWADVMATQGFSDDAPEVSPGPDKYGSFWLRVHDHVRAYAVQCRKLLPRDSAPNNSILSKVVAVNTFRAVSKRDTSFALRFVRRAADGLPIAHSVSRCSEAEYRTWVKVLSGTYPVQEYLHRIKKASSPTCPHCTTGNKETLTHFVSCCPRFHDARTLAHNKVRAMLSTSLSRYIPSGWKLREETPMAATGLTLHPVPTACILAAGRTLPVDAGEVMSLGRWQPDLIAVSHQRRKIAIIDLCRPSDVLPAQMIEAHDRKMQSYSPLLTALQHYTAGGWKVEIFPWVVGVSGLMHSSGAHRSLKFLEIPVEKNAVLMQAVAVASVQALHGMHRVRCAIQSRNAPSHGRRGSGRSGPVMQVQPRRRRLGTVSPVSGSVAAQHAIFDTDDPGRRCNGKRPHSDCNDLEAIKARWSDMKRRTRQRS